MRALRPERLVAAGAICAGLIVGLLVAAGLRGAREPARRTQAQGSRELPESGVDERAPLEAPSPPAIHGDDTAQDVGSGASAAPRPVGADGAVTAPTTHNLDTWVSRRGLARNGLLASYDWSDTALEPSYQEDAKRRAEQWERMPEHFRRVTADIEAAVLLSARRGLEVENELGGEPLGDVGFQVVGGPSLGASFIAYAGRDLPMPASPRESLEQWERAKDVRVDQGRRRDALALISRLETEQASRRSLIVQRLLALAQGPAAEEPLDVAAIWAVDGVVRFQEFDQEMPLIAESWNEVRREYLRRVAEILR